MAPVVKNGKIVSGTATTTATPSTGDSVAAGSTATRSAGGGTKKTSPDEAELFQPSMPEIEPASVASGQQMEDFVRSKLEAQRDLRPKPPSMPQRAAEAAAMSAATMTIPMLGTTIPTYYAAQKIYEKGPEFAQKAKAQLVGGLERAAKDYGDGSGLRRVAQLAYEYLPGGAPPEIQTESPRPRSAAAQAGPLLYTPQEVRQPSARQLSSVAEFRKFYETELRNLATQRANLERIDAEIKTAPASVTADEYHEMAKRRGALKQAETDTRATLLRSGLTDAEINALLRGEVPATQ